MATTDVLVDLDFKGNARGTNVPDPILPGHMANKDYVDKSVEGTAWKISARVATQGNINIASPGASVDGVAMAANDRVLVRAQTAGAENGIYIWNGAAVAMTRSLDANTFAELKQATLTVDAGTSANATFRQTILTGTLEVTALAFGNFGTSAPTATETTAGISEQATQAEVDAGTAGNFFVRPETLAAWTGKLKRGGNTFGDGSATSYTFTHSFNTEDVTILTRYTGGNKNEFMCERRVAPNSVTLLFNVAPALNSMRVVVFA
jgi:hypothetical protein